MAAESFSWKSDSGVKIFAKIWSGEDKPKGVLCIIHGLGEHIERYQHVAEFYNKNGWVVMGLDHQGHGKSGGKRGHAVSYDALLDDIDKLIQDSRRRFPDLPIVMYGHSMGGNLTLNYFFRKNPDIKAVVATGPHITLDNPPPKLLISVAKFLRGIAPGIQQDNGLDLSSLTNDQAVIDAYQNDDLVHPKVTFGLAVGLFDGADYLLEQKGEVNKPVLLMHGADDRITSPKGTTTLSKQLSGDVTLKIWEGMLHEIHNENDKQNVFDYTLEWINSKL